VTIVKKPRIAAAKSISSARLPSPADLADSYEVWHAIDVAERAS
jgi:hypothetical protein